MKTSSMSSHVLDYKSTLHIDTVFFKYTLLETKETTSIRKRKHFYLTVKWVLFSSLCLWSYSSSNMQTHKVPFFLRVAAVWLVQDCFSWRILNGISPFWKVFQRTFLVSHVWQIPYHTWYVRAHANYSTAIFTRTILIKIKHL